MYVFALGLGRLKDLILQLKINLADGTLLFGQPAPTSYFSLLPFPRYAQIDLAFCEFLRLSPMVVGFSALLNSAAINPIGRPVLGVLSITFSALFEYKFAPNCTVTSTVGPQIATWP